MLLDFLPWRTGRAHAIRHNQNELASSVDFRRASGGATVWRLELADSWLGRLRGLMFRRSLELDAGLYLPGTKSLHMMFMRFPIDCVFLGKLQPDGSRRVVALRERLSPWTGVVWWVSGADGAVEVAAGSVARAGLQPGDTVTLVDPAGRSR